MHVATIYTLYGRRAGAEMCFEKALEAMRRLRPEVQWTVFCNREAQRVLAEVLPGLRTVYVSWLDSQFKKAFWLEFLSASAVRAVAPDVFWIPSGTNNFPGRWEGVPTVTTFHDLGEYRISGKYDFVRTVFRKRICIPRAVRRSAAFTAVSRFTAGDLDRFLGLRDRVTVVHNGPSPHAVIPVEDPAAVLQREFSLDAGRFFFVPGRTDYVGKGLDLILEAYARLKEEVFANGLQIVLVGPKGDGHERFLEHRARLDAKGETLRYLGRVDARALEALYQGSLATVLPSRFEGFGFPVLEAMDRDVPVLCSDAGSLPEVAGGGALLFRSGDVGDLCAKMRQLAADPDLREQLAKKGHDRSRRFSWEACATGMLEAFERVRDRSQAAGGAGTGT